MQKLKGRRRSIDSLAFAPDLPYLAVAGTHCDVDIWDTNTGVRIAQLEEHRLYHRWDSIRFVFGGKLFVPHHHGWLLYDVDQQHQEWNDAHRTQPSLAISPDGRHIVAYRFDEMAMFERLERRDLSEFQLWSTNSTKVGYTWRQLAMCQNDMFIAIEDRQPQTVDPSQRQQLAMRRVRSSELVARWPSLISSHGMTATTDGRHVACFDTHAVHVWRLDKPGTSPTEFADLTSQRITRIALHPSGDIIAVLTGDPCLRLFDTHTGRLLTTFEWSIGTLQAVAFSDDGLRAAVGSSRGKVVVWDVE